MDNRRSHSHLSYLSNIAILHTLRCAQMDVVTDSILHGPPTCHLSNRKLQSHRTSIRRCRSLQSSL